MSISKTELFLWSALAAFLALIGYMMIHSFHHGDKEVSYSVPAKFCHEQYTGHTEQHEYMINVCYAFDKNGLCTMNIPQYKTVTKREVNVQCAYVEWR